jgi:hypothetical protein
MEKTGRSYWLVLAKVNIQSIVVFVTTVFVSFPYTKLLPVNAITQPYSLVLGIMVLLTLIVKGVPIDTGIMAKRLGLLSLFGSIAFLFSSLTYLDYGSVKWLVSYISPFVLFVVYRHWLKESEGVVYVAMSISIFIWFFVGIIQSTLDPTFLTSLVGERHSEAAGVLAGTGRGAFCLAHEPTHHAFHMVLMVGVVSLIRWTPIYLPILFASALVIAMSSSALLCMLLAGAAMLVRMRLSDKMVVVGILAVLATLVFTIVPEESRIRQILSMTFTTPDEMVLSDSSLNMRVGGIYAGIDSTIRNLFIPAGLSHTSWLLDLNRYYMEYPWLYDISHEGWPSGYIIIMYQMGFMSFPMLLIIKESYKRALVCEPWVSFVVICSLNVFIFQFYITAPLYGVLLAALVAKTGVGLERKRIKGINCAEKKSSF